MFSGSSLWRSRRGAYFGSVQMRGSALSSHFIAGSSAAVPHDLLEFAHELKAEVGFIARRDHAA